MVDFAVIPVNMDEDTDGTRTAPGGHLDSGKRPAYRGFRGSRRRPERQHRGGGDRRREQRVLRAAAGRQRVGERVGHVRPPRPAPTTAAPTTAAPTTAAPTTAAPTTAAPTDRRADHGTRRPPPRPRRPRPPTTSTATATPTDTSTATAAADGVAGQPAALLAFEAPAATTAPVSLCVGSCPCSRAASAGRRPSGPWALGRSAATCRMPRSSCNRPRALEHRSSALAAGPVTGRPCAIWARWTQPPPSGSSRRRSPSRSRRRPSRRSA